MPPEADFQAWVVRVFQANGWTVKHVPVPMKAVGGGRFVRDTRGAGLPDLLLVHDDPPRVVWAECKAADGRMSDPQLEMMRLLRCVSDRVRDRFAPDASPVGAFVFAPGNEALIEAVARGASL